MLHVAERVGLPTTKYARLGWTFVGISISYLITIRAKSRVIHDARAQSAARARGVSQRPSSTLDCDGFLTKFQFSALLKRSYMQAEATTYPPWESRGKNSPDGNCIDANSRRLRTPSANVNFSSHMFTSVVNKIFSFFRGFKVVMVIASPSVVIGNLVEIVSCR